MRWRILRSSEYKRPLICSACMGVGTILWGRKADSTIDSQPPAPTEPSAGKIRLTGINKFIRSHKPCSFFPTLLQLSFASSYILYCPRDLADCNRNKRGLPSAGIERTLRLEQGSCVDISDSLDVFSCYQTSPPPPHEFLLLSPLRRTTPHPHISKCPQSTPWSLYHQTHKIPNPKTRNLPRRSTSS